METANTKIVAAKKTIVVWPFVSTLIPDNEIAQHGASAMVILS